MGNQPGKSSKESSGKALNKLNPFKPKQNFGGQAGGQATGYKQTAVPAGQAGPAGGNGQAGGPAHGNSLGAGSGTGQSRLLAQPKPRAANPRFTGGGVSGSKVAAGDTRSAEEKEFERAYVAAQAEEMGELLATVADAPVATAPRAFL